MNSNLIILTFIVTALWDVALRFMSLNFEKIPSIIQYSMPFDSKTIKAAVDLHISRTS